MFSPSIPVSILTFLPQTAVAKVSTIPVSLNWDSVRVSLTALHRHISKLWLTESPSPTIITTIK